MPTEGKKKMKFLLEPSMKDSRPSLFKSWKESPSPSFGCTRVEVKPGQRKREIMFFASKKVVSKKAALETDFSRLSTKPM